MPRVRSWKALTKHIYDFDAPQAEWMETVKLRVAGLPDDERKAFKVLEDLLDRRGFRQLWEDIENDDPAICNEIYQAIRKAIGHG